MAEFPEPVGAGEPGGDAQPDGTLDIAISGGESDQSDKAEPQAQPQPQAQPEPQGDSKYGGKSPEELSRLLEEKDRYIAEQAQAAAQARHDAQYFRTLTEQSGGPFPGPAPAPSAPMAPQGPQTPVPPMGLPFDPSTVVSEEEFVQNPIAASAKIALAMREYERAVESQRQTYLAAESAKRNFVEGRQKAFTSTPGLFQGLENQVSEAVAQAYKDKLLSPNQLLEPKTWQLAAQMVRWERGEYDLGKYYRPAQPPTPVEPGLQQIPSARQAASGPSTLTPEQRQLVQMWGVKDEAAFLRAYEKERGNA